MFNMHEMAKWLVSTARAAGVPEHAIEEWATDARIERVTDDGCDFFGQPVDAQGVRDAIAAMVG